MTSFKLDEKPLGSLCASGARGVNTCQCDHRGSRQDREARNGEPDFDVEFSTDHENIVG